MRYFAIIDGQQVGPYTLDELAQAGVRPDTYVWCKEYDDWKQAREDGEICRYFRRRLFDRMHPTAEVPVAQPVENASAISPEQQDRLEKLHNVPPRFRYPLMKSQTDFDWPDPNAPEDISKAPTTWYPFPMLLSLLFCAPIGIYAIFEARKAQAAWQRGEREEAHERARRGKMAAGMAFAVGLILIALLISAI